MCNVPFSRVVGVILVLAGTVVVVGRIVVLVVVDEPVMPLIEGPFGKLASLKSSFYVV